eukprot:TRINITY_DN70913_c0_g1_i1.p1 TRINITY_DN70913_c0_g1~~TRINITY_DN70913_c0_g1_i1.p1  ORF type:complete len:212 (+),score=47.86 TRINITY_DN70913_c0_g1_i1:73-636(+)
MAPARLVQVGSLNSDGSWGAGLAATSLSNTSTCWTAACIAAPVPAFLIFYVIRALRLLPSDGTYRVQRSHLSSAELIQVAVLLLLAVSFPLSCAAAAAESTGSLGSLRLSEPQQLLTTGFSTASSKCMLQLHFALLAVLLVTWTAHRPQAVFAGLEGVLRPGSCDDLDDELVRVHEKTEEMPKDLRR